MRIDPRIKLLIILSLTTLSVLSKDIVYLAVVAIITIIIDILLRINIISSVKRIKYLISLIIFISLMQSLTIKGGAVLVHIGSVRIISLKGLIFGAEFALRMSIIIFASLIASTSEGNEMTDALIKLKIPYEIAFMVMITIRFLPMFGDEFRNRLNAVVMRGINIKKLKFNKKIQLYSYIMSSTLSGSVIKSRELAKSIESRGFRAYRKRTILRELHLIPSDNIIGVTTLLITAAFLIFMYTKGEIL